jgi:hypothetical protein
LGYLSRFYLDFWEKPMKEGFIFDFSYLPGLFNAQYLIYFRKEKRQENETKDGSRYEKCDGNPLKFEWNLVAL